jgi:methyltransferase (TIGR00027 family)
VPTSEKLLVSHISDTALWAAAYRALETKRADALFQDPFAGELAGEKGWRIAREVKGGEKNAWSFIIRTRSFDDFILETVKNQRVDAILNLGSGLDTRPYRLPLPKNLKWFDVDFPDIVSYMQEKMKGHSAHCQLERLAWNISDEVSRKNLFSTINQKAKKVLLVTEGVITYFKPEQVESLVRDLNQEPCFRFWLHDFYSRKVVLSIKKRWEKQFPSNATFHFAPEDWLGFFEQRGWKILRAPAVYQEAQRLKRKIPFIWTLWVWLSKAKIIHEKTPSGYVLLERS